MSVKASAETLRNIPIFADCDPVHLQLLAFSAPRQDFPPQSVIFEKGGAGDAAYLVLTGAVEIGSQAMTEGAQEKTVVGPGTLLGESAMIAGRPYPFSARARGEVDTVRIDRTLFMRVAEEYPEFAARVFRTLTRRLDGSLAELSDTKAMFDRARSFSGL